MMLKPYPNSYETLAPPKLHSNPNFLPCYALKPYTMTHSKIMYKKHSKMKKKYCEKEKRT